ncbi:uncharacterized protein [Diadema antillarum]|uniref:uncharacterized protein n=1 Tax=Diadema antillarum TaxID=105358 RepID=UPI003A84F64F
MATKNLIKRKSVEKDRVLRNEKCPIFNVQYLGKMPARGEYGREYIAEPVEALIKLKERQKLQRSALQISEKGFHFLDFNGPFGKEKHVLIPIHHICYGVADEQNPRVFAIITRTDSNPDSSLFECHAFLCERKKNASEITYWLLRTFLEVFEDLQRRRRLRQDRRIRRQQALVNGVPGPAFELSPPTSPTDSMSAADMTMYSVILDGSKSKGAAVRLARNHGTNRPVSFPPGAPVETASGPQIHAGMAPPRDIYAGASSSMGFPPPGQRMMAEPTLDVHNRSVHGDYPFVRHFDPRQSVNLKNGEPPPVYTQRPPVPIQQSDTLKHTDPYNQQNGTRYSKNPALGRSRSSTGNASSTDETNSTLFSDSFSGVSREEADFIFIEMLQEEFGGLDLSGPGGPAGVSGNGRVASKTERSAPPDQKLRSEDIEKRVREWLQYEEGDSAVFSSLSPKPSSPSTIRRPAGYNPGYVYQSSYRGDTRSRSTGRTLGSQSSVTSDKDYF